MSIAPGTRLGPYEVVSLLGRGGMGEVYRARDARLGRDVAIKVLPPALAADPDRRARFEREAQVLASLNHPNIAAVYGLEESGSTMAIVLELVEGPTLEEKMGALSTSGGGQRSRTMPAVERGLSSEEVLPIARQITDALEAAHEKGIVHRDLKPANIKLAPDGRIKVLDFGLAKALAPVLSGVDQESSPTLTTPAMTALGMLLGTAAYMAPEQARGQTVDKRADIWAFGVVLFEMLTGTRLFHGATVSDTIAAVLRQDIDWTTLPPDTPPALVRLLRRCLDREPKRRLRDIGEARLALDAASDEPGAAAPALTAPPVQAPPRRFGLVHLVAAALSIALIAAAAALWSLRRDAEIPDVRLSVSLPGDLLFNLANRPVIAISSDGSKLAIVAQSKSINRLYLRPMKEFDLRPLPGTEGASGPFFSPDGAWIGFFADGKLKKIPADGGPVVSLADADDPRNAVWTADDVIFYTPASIGPVYRIPSAGGTPEPISKLDAQKQERTHRWPSALPDGKTILFTVGSVAHPDDYDDASIEAVRLETGTRHVIVKGGRMASYASSGHLLYVRGRLLYAVPFDTGRLEVRGMPVPVVDGVSGDTTTGASNYAISATGVLAYVPGDPSGANRRIGWVDLKGNATLMPVPAAAYVDPHVSPDDRRIAVSIISSASVRDIWVIDAVRGTSSRLTFGGLNRTPIWSRDGKVLFYITYDSGKNVSAITMKSADGRGVATQVREIPGQAYLEDLTPDGSTLLLSSTGTMFNAKRVAAPITARAAIYRVPLMSATSEPEVVVAEAYNAAVSPNGRWLAYVSRENGRDEVYVESFGSAGGRAQVSTSGGVEPHWSPDGRALYYLQNDQLVTVPIEPGAAFAAGRPQVLFGGVAQVLTDSVETYNVAPGGNRFVMMRPADDRVTLAEVRLDLNWFAALRRLSAK